MTLRDIAISLGFKVDESQAKKAENRITDIKNVATKLLGAIGIGFSLSKFRELTEEFNGVNDQIRQATQGMGDQKDIQQQILKTANDVKMSYGDIAKMVSRLTQEDKNLFGSVDEAAEFVELSTKLFKTANKSNQEIASLQEAINKSFAKGIVDTETINQLYEKAPEAINLISDSLGVSKDKLAKMATDGVLKVSDLKNAFIKNADVINAGFDNLEFSISDAMLNIRNQWGLYLDDLNSSMGITQTVARFAVRGFSQFIEVLKKAQTGVERVSKHVGGMKNLLKLVATAAGGIFLALNAGKILDFLKGVGKFIGNIQIKTMAIIAVVVALALIVDDFINFMKGNDSVIGSMLEAAGVDTGKVRDTIIGAWKAVKDFLKNTWTNIKDFAKAIWNGLKDFWSEHGESIKAMFSAIWDAVTQILSVAFRLIFALVKSIFGALKAFWDRWGDQIKAAFSILADFFGRTFGRFIEIIRQFAEFLSAIFAGDIQGALQSLLGIFQTILEQIVDVVQTVFTLIWTFIGDKVTAIKDTIVNGFQAAIDWITSLPEKALQWGRDFIDGLVNGIKGAISKVGDAVKGVADKIKSFLHFSVPDEGPLTSYESWMPDFMQGLATGIHKNAHLVRDAVKGLAGDMTIMANAATPSGLTAQTASSAISNRSIVQNVEIKNTFEGGSTDAQAKGAKAMEKSADDATARMARALSATR